MHINDALLLELALFLDNLYGMGSILMLFVYNSCCIGLGG